MKKNSIAACGLVALICTASIVVAGALADDVTKTRSQPRNNRAQAAEFDSKTAGASVRASQLIGTNIQNNNGEGIGEINDIVLDVNTGQARYAAVTYGGLLGVGDKMFAVPFRAFEIKADPDDRDDHIVVLNVTKQQLEGQEGFDQSHWPNFADRKLTADLNKRYGIDRRTRNRDRLRNRNSDRDVDIDVGPDGINIDVDNDEDN